MKTVYWILCADAVYEGLLARWFFLFVLVWTRYSHMSTRFYHLPRYAQNDSVSLQLHLPYIFGHIDQDYE